VGSSVDYAHGNQSKKQAIELVTSITGWFIKGRLLHGIGWAVVPGTDLTNMNASAVLSRRNKWSRGHRTKQVTECRLKHEETVAIGLFFGFEGRRADHVELVALPVSGTGMESGAMNGDG
jgi:hypothetical protein